MTRRIGLLTIFLMILAITSLAAGDPSRVHSHPEVVEIVVHDDETTAQRLNHEEWVEWLHQTGLQKEQVDLLVEYDRQIELAHQNGASREELERITEQLNKKMREQASEGEAEFAPTTLPKDKRGGGLLRGWSSDTKYISASCGNGPTASWRTDQGDWYSAFKEYLGDYWVGSGYCWGTYCNITRSLSRPGTWDFHQAIGYNPRNHSAGCW